MCPIDLSNAGDKGEINKQNKKRVSRRIWTRDLQPLSAEHLAIRRTIAAEV